MKDEMNSLSRIETPWRPILAKIPRPESAQSDKQTGSVPPPPKSSRVVSSIPWLLVAALAALLLLQLYKAQTLQINPAPAVTAAVASRISMPETEDLLRHLDASDTNIRKALDEMNRSEQWMERIAPSLDHEYMQMDKKRLQAAVSASVLARRNMQQSRDELGIARDHLLGRTIKDHE